MVWLQAGRLMSVQRCMVPSLAVLACCSVRCWWPAVPANAAQLLLSGDYVSRHVASVVCLELQISRGRQDVCAAEIIFCAPVGGCKVFEERSTTDVRRAFPTCRGGSAAAVRAQDCGG